MKQTKTLRTLEELWDVEDRHPLLPPPPATLLRWMRATGLLTPSSEVRRKAPPRSTKSELRRGGV